MKKALLTLIALLFLLQGKSQITYTYTYDASGNRTKRVSVTVKSLGGESIYNQETRELKDTYTASESLEDHLDDRVITLYPNPTRGELVLRINPLPENPLGKITVFGIDGRQYFIFSNLSEYNDLDLTDLNPGNYIILLELNGQRTTYEVIKE
jgi:hypothetical protein